MSDTIRSLIRTWVPIGVGAALAWLATLGLPPEAGAGLIVFFRSPPEPTTRSFALEEQWPWLGVLVGPRCAGLRDHARVRLGRTPPTGARLSSCAPVLYPLCLHLSALPTLKEIS